MFCLLKKRFFSENWLDFFNSCCDRMLSSLEMYVTYVIYACRQVTFVVPKIFEIFLIAFAFMLRITIETVRRKKVNYSILFPDIFMVFYENEFIKKNQRSGGFSRFVEYINNPNYLKLNCLWRNVFNCDNLNFSTKHVIIKLLKPLWKIMKMPSNTNLADAEKDDTSSVSTKMVISRINESVPLATIQQLTQLEKAERLLEMAEETRDIKETLECGSNLNSDSVSNNESVGQMADNASYEKIIEAVIRHNDSKISSHGKSKGRIQTQAGIILDHLKSTIKTLVEVLDE